MSRNFLVQSGVIGENETESSNVDWMTCGGWMGEGGCECFDGWVVWGVGVSVWRDGLYGHGCMCVWGTGCMGVDECVGVNRGGLGVCVWLCVGVCG